MHEELRDALANLGDARVVVLTGAGRGFCAGQDLNDRAVAPGEAVDLGETVERAGTRSSAPSPSLPQPVIARVNGVAAGAGANIALACDIVVAAKSAKFIQSFSAIGLIPDSGGTWVLPRLVGQARALGLALTGEPLTAEKAAEWGLIWKAVDDDALDAEVDAIATKLASLPPLGLAAIKEMIRSSWQYSLDEELDARPEPCAASASPKIIAKASPPSSKSAEPTFTGKLTSSANFAEVDIAARHHADDRPIARLAGQRRGQRQRARAFGNRPRFLRDQPHRLAGLVERDDDRAVDQRPHPLPHALGDALPAGAVDERCLPVGELAAAALLAAKERKAPPSRARRRASRASGRSALIALPTPVISPPPPIAQMTVRTSGNPRRSPAPWCRGRR